VVESVTVAAMPFDDDEALAVAARTDVQAFAELYARHRSAVFAYLRARTSADDAADLTATTFERAWKALPRYRPRDGGFRAWLFRIASNAAIDHHRRTRSSDAVPEPIVRSTEDEVVAHEQLAELIARVAQLGSEQREAIALRYAGGLTAREIGVVMGKSEAAAQKLVSRGLASLKEAYGVG
jgi:RNA polymerase sigma-70 factor, ECF subfamily